MREREFVVRLRVPQLPRRRWLIIAATAVVCFGALGYAAITTFAPNEVLSATKMNANFQDLDGRFNAGLLKIGNGGTGIAAAPTAAGQYLRSSGAGAWAVAALPAADVSGNLTNATIDAARVNGPLMVTGYLAGYPIALTAAASGELAHITTPFPASGFARVEASLSVSNVAASPCVYVVNLSTTPGVTNTSSLAVPGTVQVTIPPSSRQEIYVSRVLPMTAVNQIFYLDTSLTCTDVDAVHMTAMWLPVSTIMQDAVTIHP